MQLQNRSKYNNDALRRLCDKYAAECNLSFERYGQGKPATLELLAMQMVLEEHCVPTTKMQMQANSENAAGGKRNKHGRRRRL